MNSATARDWLDEASHEDGWTPLVCAKCGEAFHGWKLKTICFVCAVPAFPPHTRHISHSAVRFGGDIYALPAPHRHHHVLRMIHQQSGKTWPNIQGFLDNRGKFLDRRNALRLALHAKQVLQPATVRGGKLYSEDLW